MLGPRMLGQQVAYGELTISVEPQAIVEVMTMLRTDPELQFISFIDLAGVDWPAREQRFDVVYHLLSPRKNARIRIKLATDADTPVPSISDVFPAATWFEREAYDLYGILFSGNPDLRRILTDYGFRGYPLRKDFRLPAMSRSVTTMSRGGSSTNRSSCRKSSGISISCRLGRALITCCPATKR
jgi:NADH-quinone oxidoreductase subunit C